MAQARGMTSTTDILSADLVVDMAKKVLLLEGNRAKLIKFVGRMRKEKAIQPKFSWELDQYVPFATAINNGGGYNTSATALVVDHGDRCNANDLWLNFRTGEIYLVESVSSNTLTVATRPFAGSATAINDNDVLIKVGSAWGEGSSLRDSSNNILSLEPVKEEAYNYTQVERTPFSVTGTQEATGAAGGLHSGDPLKHQAMLKGMEHLKKMNSTAYMGKRAISGNRRTTGGFIEFITSNTSGTTSYTEATLNEDIDEFFRYGEERKTLFCSKRVSRKITGLASAQQRITPGEDKYGVRIREYLGNAGVLEIVPDDTLENGYETHGLVIDMTDVAYRFIPTRDTKLYLNAQLPDVDGKVNAYLTEWGLQRGHEQHHGMWTAIAA